MKYFLLLPIICLIFFFVSIVSIQNAEARSCICGFPIMEEVHEDVTPMCVGISGEKYADESCKYDCQYWICEGGRWCQPVTINHTPNECLIYWYCEPVQTINNCSDEEEGEYYFVTIVWNTAFVHNTLISNWDNCFSGFCDGSRLPQCEDSDAVCPG